MKKRKNYYRAFIPIEIIIAVIAILYLTFLFSGCGYKYHQKRLEKLNPQFFTSVVDSVFLIKNVDSVITLYEYDTFTISNKYFKTSIYRHSGDSFTYSQNQINPYIDSNNVINYQNLKKASFEAWYYKYIIIGIFIIIAIFIFLLFILVIRR